MPRMRSIVSFSQFEEGRGRGREGEEEGEGKERKRRKGGLEGKTSGLEWALITINFLPYYLLES